MKKFLVYFLEGFIDLQQHVFVVSIHATQALARISMTRAYIVFGHYDVHQKYSLIKFCVIIPSKVDFDKKQ